jgi:hypothetical protein
MIGRLYNTSANEIAGIAAGTSQYVFFNINFLSDDSKIEEATAAILNGDLLAFHSTDMPLETPLFAVAELHNDMYYLDKFDLHSVGSKLMYNTSIGKHISNNIVERYLSADTITKTNVINSNIALFMALSLGDLALASQLMSNYTIDIYIPIEYRTHLVSLLNSANIFQYV